MDLPFNIPESSRKLPEDISEDFLIKLGLNAVGMMHSLPDRSYYKKYLMQFLAR